MIPHQPFCVWEALNCFKCPPWRCLFFCCFLKTLFLSPPCDRDVGPSKRLGSRQIRITSHLCLRCFPFPKSSFFHKQFAFFWQDGLNVWKGRTVSELNRSSDSPPRCCIVYPPNVPDSQYFKYSFSPRKSYFPPLCFRGCHPISCNTPIDKARVKSNHIRCHLYWFFFQALLEIAAVLFCVVIEFSLPRSSCLLFFSEEKVRGVSWEQQKSLSKSLRDILIFFFRKVTVPYPPIFPLIFLGFWTVGFGSALKWSKFLLFEGLWK